MLEAGANYGALKSCELKTPALLEQCVRVLFSSAATGRHITKETQFTLRSENTLKKKGRGIRMASGICSGRVKELDGNAFDPF